MLVNIYMHACACMCVCVHACDGGCGRGHVHLYLCTVICIYCNYMHTLQLYAHTATICTYDTAWSYACVPMHLCGCGRGHIHICYGVMICMYTSLSIYLYTCLGGCAYAGVCSYGCVCVCT